MRKNNNIKVVIDTNLWVSFFISQNYYLNVRKRTLAYDGTKRTLRPVGLLDEINLVISKPKIKKYFSVNAMEDMLTSLDEIIELIEVNSIVEICRDKKDNFLLALAKDGKADYLLTGDKDLLELQKIDSTKIVTFTKFLEITVKKQ